MIQHIFCYHKSSSSIEKKKKKNLMLSAEYDSITDYLLSILTRLSWIKWHMILQRVFGPHSLPQWPCNQCIRSSEHNQRNHQQNPIQKQIVCSLIFLGIDWPFIATFVMAYKWKQKLLFTHRLINTNSIKSTLTLTGRYEFAECSYRQHEHQSATPDQGN